jgi:hypothetical protein
MHSASEKAAVFTAMHNELRQMKPAAKRKKDFETECSGVFAPPGSLLAHFSTAGSGFNVREPEGNRADFSTLNFER